MMIVVVLLSLVVLSSASVARIREQEPIMIDGEEGVLFELPDYEDPQLVDYELSAMGGSPVLSLLQLPKNRPREATSSTTDSAPKESATSTKGSSTKASAETILELSEIIHGLQALQSNIQNGDDINHRNEFIKAIRGLQKLESSFGADIHQLMNSMQQSTSILKPMIKIGIMPLFSGKSPKNAVLQQLAIDTGAIFGMQFPFPVESKLSDRAVKSTMSPTELLEHEEKDQQDDEVAIYKSKWTFKSR